MFEFEACSPRVGAWLGRLCPAFVLDWISGIEVRLGKRSLLTPTLSFNDFVIGCLKEFRIIKENTSLGAAGPPSLSEILGGHMAWKMLRRTFSQLYPIGNSNPNSMELKY